MNNQNVLVLYAIGLFLSSILFVGLYAHYARQRGVIDAPNDRSSHQGLIPRGAGIVFLGLWLVSAFLGYQVQIFSGEILLLSLPLTLVMGLIGFWDDNKGLSAKKRLILQFTLALLFIFSLFYFAETPFALNFNELGWLLSLIYGVLGIISIIWSVNLYNFMDGTDGLAAIEAFFVLGVGGFLCYQHGAIELGLLAFAMLIAVAGFLVWNWPKASVFMGDVGSYCLGGLISVLAILGYWLYQIPLGLWLILYGLFWFDATLTLLRRLFAKKNITAAHREHAYQRFHQAGFSQQQLLFGVIGLNTLLAFLACLADKEPEYLNICLILSIILLTFITLWIERRKPILKNT